jgi:hypothetical protein
VIAPFPKTYAAFCPSATPSTHPTQDGLGIPLARAHHEQQRPIREAYWHIGQYTFERSHVGIANDSDHEPTEDHKVLGLGAAKNGLEGIEKVVYVAGYACALPHGLAPEYVGVWWPSNIYWSSCYASSFHVDIHLWYYFYPT